MRFRATILLVLAAIATTPASHVCAQRVAPLSAPVLATTLRPPNPSDALLGVVSPDGRYYVYQQVEHAQTRLRLLDLATGRSRLLTARGGSRWDITWSPDGRRIAYVGQQGDLQSEEPLGIWVLDVTAPRERLVYTESEGRMSSRPAWLADGRILFSSYMIGWALALDDGQSAYAPPPHTLRVVDPGTRRIAVLDSSSFGLDEPALSPDGKQLAYMAPCADTTRWGVHVTVLRTPLTASARCLATVPHLAGSAPMWSPDSRVVYLAEPGERDSLRMTVVDVATGRATRLAWPGVGRDAQLSVATDGRLLVAASATTFRIGTVPAAGGPVTLFQRDTVLQAAYPVWSNDGSRIVAMADTSRSWRGIPRLYGAPTRAGDPRRAVLQLIDFMRDEQPFRATAPDGRCAVGRVYMRDSSIVLEAVHPTDSWFTRDAFTYADAVRSAEGSHSGSGGTQWSNDGRFVLRAADGKLYRASRDRASVESSTTPCRMVGSVRRLPLRGFVGDPVLGRVSPDGRTLAFSRVARDGRDAGVFLVGTEGGPVRRVRALPRDESLGGPEWSRDGRALYFADADAEHRYHIMRLMLTTGAVDTVSRGVASVMHPQLSPDGTTIAVTIIDAATKLWWITPTRSAAAPRH